MQTKCFIHAQWNRYDEKFHYSVQNCDMSEYGYIFLEEKEVFFESPNDKALRVLCAKALTAKKNKELAEAMKVAQETQVEIDEMLAIEYKPEEIPSEEVVGNDTIL